jgi:hypothetical protein
MPERIDGVYPFYVWDQVLDGETWRCTNPRDFTTAAKTFAYEARREARNRGLKVDVKIENNDTVVVRSRESGRQRRVQIAS